MTGKIIYFSLMICTLIVGVIEIYLSRTRNNPNAVPFRWRPAANRHPSFYYQSRTHHLVDGAILLLIAAAGLAFGVWQTCAENPRPACTPRADPPAARVSAPRELEHE